MSKQLFKPNDLLQATLKMKLDRLARHLGNYFFEHAQKMLCFENYTDKLFYLNIKDLNEVAGIGSKDYGKIQKAIKTLQQPVEIRTPENEYRSIVIFPEIGVNFETSDYYFELKDCIRELLIKKGFFTKLELLEMNPLESKHSHLIIEWLKMNAWQDPIPAMSIEDLRSITYTANSKAYDNFSNIKTRILDVAVREINEKTPYTVSYEAIKKRAKTRNKVTELRWTFESKAEPEQSNVSNTTHDISIHGRYAELADLYVKDGFCDSEADFYKATYIADLRLLNWFYGAKKHMTKAKNKIKYLLGDIEKGSKNGRWQSQRDVYKALLARLSAKDQAFMLEKQATQGFYEQIQIMKKHLEDATAIKDPEKWL